MKPECFIVGDSKILLDDEECKWVLGNEPKFIHKGGGGVLRLDPVANSIELEKVGGEGSLDGAIQVLKDEGGFTEIT